MILPECLKSSCERKLIFRFFGKHKNWMPETMESHNFLMWSFVIMWCGLMITWCGFMAMWCGFTIMRCVSVIMWCGFEFTIMWCGFVIMWFCHYVMWWSRFVIMSFLRCVLWFPHYVIRFCHRLCLLVYSAAGYGFQNTRYPAVWNSPIIFPIFLIDFFKEDKTFVCKPQTIPKIALALK